MNYKAILFFLFCLLYCATIGVAQQVNTSEQIEQLLKSSRKQASKQPKKAIIIGIDALNAARKGAIAPLIAKSFKTIGIVYKKNAKYDSALVYYDSALWVYQVIPDSVGIGSCYNNKGNVYKNMNQYRAALDHHEKALRIRTSMKDSVGISSSYNNIGLIYLRLGLLEQAHQYILESVKIDEQLLPIQEQVIGLNNLGLINAQLHRHNKALSCYTKVEKILSVHSDAFSTARNLRNMALVWYDSMQYKKALQMSLQALDSIKEFNEGGLHWDIYNTIGVISLRQKDVPQALRYYRKALKLAYHLGHRLRVASSLTNMAEILNGKTQFLPALDSLQKALAISTENGNRGLTKTIYLNLSHTYAGLNNYDLFQQYQQLYTSLKDSLYNESVLQKTTLMQELYESEKKDKQILAQQRESEAQQFRIYSLGGAIISIVLIGFFAIRYYYLKRNTAKRALVQEQTLVRTTKDLMEKTHEYDLKRIDELISSQELEKLKAMIDGEEKAKNEIAADIHDSVNNLLNAVQINFDSLGNKIEFLEEQQQAQYEQVNDLLHKTSDELQQISSKLKSGTLVKFGLKPALYELQELLPVGDMQTHITIHGLHERLEAKTELELYRIAQELFGNAVKHAQATEFDLQIHQDEEGLRLTVEDNGKGFDFAAAQSKNRMGLHNVKVRAQKLGGTAMFETAIDQGTTVMINIPVK